MGESETPIEKEVEAVLQLAPAGSAVAIDDARCFGSDPHYPPLTPWLARLQTAGVTGLRVANDMIYFVVPPKQV